MRSDPVLVVGGGVIGLSIAWELARRQVPVEVLERGPEAGIGASRVAAGMLAPWSEIDTQPEALTRLGVESLDRYPGFVASLEEASGRPCDLALSGTLWVAADRDEEAELDRLARRLARAGAPAARLDGEALRAREPGLAPRVRTGLEIPGEGRVDPRALVGSLVAALASRDVPVRIGAEVREVAAHAVRLDDGSELRARAVVLATGGRDPLPDGAPAAARGLRRVKGQILRVRCDPPVGRVVRASHVYLVPRASGDLLVGGTMEEVGDDARPTAGAAMELLGRGWELFPGLYDGELREHAVGFRPAFADHLPRIGPTDEGIHLAEGHYRGGVLLAPVTAWWTAERLAGGAVEGVAAELVPRRSGP